MKILIPGPGSPPTPPALLFAGVFINREWSCRLRIVLCVEVWWDLFTALDVPRWKFRQPGRVLYFYCTRGCFWGEVGVVRVHFEWGAEGADTDHWRYRVRQVVWGNFVFSLWGRLESNSHHRAKTIRLDPLNNITLIFSAWAKATLSKVTYKSVSA